MRAGPADDSTPNEASACRAAAERSDRLSTGARWAEVVLIGLIFALFAGRAPPDVGESHYLAKARHFWDSSWCAGDVFLESRSAHPVFYVAIGWIAAVFPLPVAAWIGRGLAWFALAASWQRLSFTLVPRRGWSLLTAGLWLVGMDQCHMSGEWVVGGVEAKCFAYPLVFLALETMSRGGWGRAWVYLGLATSVHVLVGGWAIVGAVLAWIASGSFRPAWKTQLAPGALGALLALPGLASAVALDWGATAETVAEARDIYVYDRLPHHLVFEVFESSQVARHVTLAIAWAALAALTPCRLAAGQLGQRPLRVLVGTGLLLAVIGAAIDWGCGERTDLAAGWLRLYWFRMSDAITPAGLAIAAAGACLQGEFRRPRWAFGGAMVLAAVAVYGTLVGAARHGVGQVEPTDPTFRILTQDGRVPPETLGSRMRQWREICDWARETTPAKTLFVTPRHQQTFKWFAERPEVATVKDVPQDAASIVEWYRRRAQLAYGVPALSWGYPPKWDYVAKWMRHWGAEWIILDTELEPTPPDWEQVYASTSGLFRVYRAPSQ